MVEGDLVDLTLPTLLQALSREGSTAKLRVQRGTDQGTDQGTLYFSEGSLIHASSGDVVGDEAVLALLGWSDGRFRIQRDAEPQPRTITHRVTAFLSGADQGVQASHTAVASPSSESGGDEQLLNGLLTMLARLEQDVVRLVDGKVEAGALPALMLVTAIVNSLVAFVIARCSDPDLLPSRVLSRLEETQPYTQLLGEENERISIATAAGVLKNWNTSPEDRLQLFRDLCRAMLDVLTMYCNTVNTFFHSSREREEWRVTFEVFVDGLWTAVQQVKV